MKRRKHLTLLTLAAAATLPGIALRLSGTHAPAPVTALLSGTAILGASFLLLWACDAAQADISQTLALAVVALIAVLPEYAVDMYFTWQAGQYPESAYAHYAVANMTGANRLLIGVAWAAIVLVFWLKTRKPVTISPERRLELLFLALATLYAFVVPLKGSLAWYDGAVFLGLYAWYMVLAGRRPCGECEIEGPAELLTRMPGAKRRAGTAALFLFAAVAIGANAEPFCEGLVGTGRILNVNEFLLVQWLAPVASEAPEFIVAISFAMRRQASLALGSLLSAKLNQWTLLVGMIPLVYAVSHGNLDHPIPMGSFQMDEIMLTAAQSLMAVVLLATLRLSIWQAGFLFAMFLAQFLSGPIIEKYPGLFPAGFTGQRAHEAFSLIYVVAALAVAADSPSRIARLGRGALRPEPESEERLPVGVLEGITGEAFEPGQGPVCRTCPHRAAAASRLRRDDSTQPR